MGKIKLPTGKIVANDPLIAEETEPFTICVTPGEYPVMLYVNHSDGDQRVAFAEIRFLEDMPVRFAPALVDICCVAAQCYHEFFIHMYSLL